MFFSNKWKKRDLLTPADSEGRKHSPHRLVGQDTAQPLELWCVCVCVHARACVLGCVCVCVYSKYVLISLGSQVASVVKNPPAIQETWVLSLDWEDPLEESVATHSSILAWKIPQTERPVGYSSWGRNWARMHHTALNFFQMHPGVKLLGHLITLCLTF